MDEAKRDLVRGWLLKAHHDLTAARLLAAGQPAILDVAIYHCQQAAEKALKGFLVHWDQRVEKTHDIGLLIERAMPIEPTFGTWSDAGDRLTPFATAYRYPGLEISLALRSSRRRWTMPIASTDRSFRSCRKMSILRLGPLRNSFL